MSARPMTTRQILLNHTKYDSDGNVDASDMLSKACYAEWVNTRKTPPRSPHTAFRDAVKKVLIGSSRVTPFPPKVEAAVLELMREKEVWPCFANLPNIGIGKRGWKVRGYHQRKMMGETESIESASGDSDSNNEEDLDIAQNKLKATPHGTELTNDGKPAGAFLTPELFSMLEPQADSTKNRCLVRKKMSSCEILLQTRKANPKTKQKIERYDSNHSAGSVDSHSILLSLLPQTGEFDSDRPAQSQQSVDIFSQNATTEPHSFKSLLQPANSQDLGSNNVESNIFSIAKKNAGCNELPKWYQTGIPRHRKPNIHANGHTRRRFTDSDFGSLGTHKYRQPQVGNVEPQLTQKMFESHNIADQRRYSFPAPELLHTPTEQPFMLEHTNGFHNHDPIQYHNEVERRAVQRKDFYPDSFEQHCTISS